MAYLDTRDMIVATTLPAPASRVDAIFSSTEWDVIALARRDSLASLRGPSRAARLLGRLFGVDVDRRHADPRLEAVRSFTVLAWHHSYTLPVSAMKAFKQAGYTLDHIELLLASVSLERARRHRAVPA